MSLLQIDAGVAPGSSGGPLIRLKDGVVLGILSGGMMTDKSVMNINFAIDIRQLF